MGPPLQPFLSGFPSNVNNKKEPEQFSLGIGRNVFSDSPSGDASDTSTGEVTQFARDAFFDKITIDVDAGIALLAGSASFDAVLEVSVRGFVIFQWAKKIESITPAGDITEQINETFDLVNPIHVLKGDLVTYTVKIQNKTPTINHDSSLQTSINLVGVLQA